MREIWVTRAAMPGYEEYCAEIRSLWDSHWLTNMGEKHRRLQENLEAFLGVPHVTLFANGHLALENTLAALDLPKGGEVITSPLTFASTTHAIARNGLTPVFCDVRAEDGTLDADQLEALVTEKTVAILPVHVYGNPCDAAAIDRVARRHGLKTVYDAAHAFGVRYLGAPVARYGDASIFSFHATKVFNTVEGGASCCGDAGLVRRMDDLKNFGIRGPEEVACVGGNAKLSEFHAAMGLCNLRHFEAERAGRAGVAKRYARQLSGVPGIRLLTPRAGTEPNYAYFPVLFEGFRLTRDEVSDRLAAAGFGTRKHFFPLTSDFDCYRRLPTADPCRTPVAHRIAEHVLSLPMYGELPPEEVDALCDILLEG